MNRLKFVVRRRWPILLAGLLIGAVLGAVTSGGSSAKAPTEWIGSQILFLDLTKAGPSGVQGIPQDAQQVVRGRTPKRAAAILGYKGDPNLLAERVVTTNLPDTAGIKIAVTDKDPRQAGAIAGAFAKAFLESNKSKDIVIKKKAVDRATSDVAQAKTDLDQFDAANPGVKTGAAGTSQLLVAQRLSLDRTYRESVLKLSDAQTELEASGTYFTNGLEQPEQAATQVLAFPKSFLPRTVLVSFLTFMMAVVLALVLERMSPRLDHREEIIEELGLPVIGEIGVLPRRHRQDKKREPVSLDLPSAEAYRRLRSTFQFVLERSAAHRSAAEPGVEQRRSGVFMIVSPSPAEGKSVTAAMSGLCLAEVGEPTLVIGCDYRRPIIDVLLSIPRTVGITSRAEMSMERPELKDIIFPAAQEHLWVAPAGTPTQHVVGCADVARELIANARNSGLTVVIDTTPILVANDAVDLLDVVDDVVLVVRAGRTSIRSARQAVQQIELRGGKILGAVMVGSYDLTRMEAYYADYYYSPDDVPVGAAPADRPPPSPGDGTTAAERNGTPGEKATDESVAPEQVSSRGVVGFGDPSGLPAIG